MNLVMLSDTHNKHHDIKVPDGDVLLHAGDATMLGTDSELENFIIWLSNLPHEHKIWVAGNHDWGMETDQGSYERFFYKRGKPTGDVNKIRKHIESLCIGLGITYLNNNGVTIKGLNIWGSPDQPAFYGWAFNRKNSELEEHWKTIPDDTNVLITHAPAYGILDVLEDGTHVGDAWLATRLPTLPSLKLHLCGHIHPSYGTVERNGVTHINGSLLDDRYQIRNKPIEVTVDN